MAKRRNRRSSYFPVKIPLNTLSGGVGRQAPTKRLPSEVEDMNNMFCTTERSIDKRNGFAPLEGLGNNLGIDPNEKNLWFDWFFVGDTQRYLFVIDFSAGLNDQLFWVFKLDTKAGILISQNVDTSLGNAVYYYLTAGGGNARDVLRSVSVGSTLLILNTSAKAGFTSDGVDDFEFNLDGTKSTTIDFKGRKIDYQTTITVDPERDAEIWSPSTNYVWGQKAIDTSDPKADEVFKYGIWKIKSDVASGSLPGPTNASSILPPSDADSVEEWERDTETIDGITSDRYTDYISVEDYTYPDPDKPYLGQSVTKFSELRFPPDANDVIARNGVADTTYTIQSLYPDSGDSAGRGKIIHLSQEYLGSTPGWYRVISNLEQPYLFKVRTPDEMSLIDQNRMPVQIYLNTENDQWSIRTVDWEPRTSGTKRTNPGPSFFQDRDGNAQQKEIKAIAFYRDRLFLASEDTLISSRLGKFDNLFLDDPANITVSDPIDLNVSSNIYTPITFLQPFRDFMFLGTSGDTQYELIGSENQISPLTAEIAPTSFFPMTTDIKPLLMNNNLFFFSKKRLFIYFGTGSNTINQQAFELSRHVPNYLPTSYWSATVSSAHNTIFVVEGDSPGNKIFCYRNQIANEQIVQNAFFTFTISGEIHSIKAIEDELYIINEENNVLQLQKISLIPDTEDIPRLDNKRETGLPSSYDSSTDVTTFYFTNNPLQNEDQIFVTQPTELQGTIINITATVGGLTATASGNFATVESGWVGNKFTAKVTLSDIFVRDDENNVIPGTLNLRYGITRHHKTGNYILGVTRKKRTQKNYTFEPNVLDDRTVEADGNLNELNGVFKFPLMGFTDDLDITISSSFPHPMNITNIELTGKFKRVPHFLTT